jgi:1,4-alpha-glucan branching enzyme
MHKGVQDLVRDLNHFYRRSPALHQGDCESDGFRWLVSDDRDNSVLAFARLDRERSHMVIVVSNFTPIARHDYRIGAPRGGYWREVINRDAACYGGCNVGNGGGLNAIDEPSHGQSHSLCLTIPPLSTLMFEWQG